MYSSNCGEEHTHTHTHTHRVNMIDLRCECVWWPNFAKETVPDRRYSIRTISLTKRVRAHTEKTENGSIRRAVLQLHTYLLVLLLVLPVRSSAAGLLPSYTFFPFISFCPGLFPSAYNTFSCLSLLLITDGSSLQCSTDVHLASIQDGVGSPRYRIMCPPSTSSAAKLVVNLMHK